MEVFMKSIAYSVDDKDLSREIARILHGRDFQDFSSIRINFRVSLLPDKRGIGRHRGLGTLTLPTQTIGNHFLSLFGEPSCRTLTMGNRKISFGLSNRAPRSDVVNEINRLPYLDPRALEKEQKRADEYQSKVVRISEIHFGWECRDWTFSSEYQRICDDSANLQFQDDAREFRIKAVVDGRTRIAAIRFSNINFTSAAIENGQAVIFISLQVPPVFESKAIAEISDPESYLSKLQDMLMQDMLLQDIFDLLPPMVPMRRRHSSFDESHAQVSIYTSTAIRLVCQTHADLQLFRDLCQIAEIPKPTDIVPNLMHKNLFGTARASAYQEWLKELPWSVAFQLDALTLGGYVDLAEILSLRDELNKCLLRTGSEILVALLRSFSGELREMWYDSEIEESVLNCWIRCVRNFKPPPPPKVDRLSDNNFLCYHIVITPTSYALLGPFPERSNRVIRSYPGFTDHFIRVSFVDENHLQYRFEREVDGKEFIRKRVGQVLNGLSIAGTHLEFLAYSQSALKEHAAWFVKPFIDKNQNKINAATIIASLGKFHNLAFDAKLGHCPARYGARISQAFTATDSSITADAEEIIIVHDIERNGYCFTDGVGTISPDLADDVCKSLFGRRRRRRRPLVKPSSFQVRIQGAKGMVSVDPTLKGRVICLRRSMIKFEAPESTHIEIARAFDRPSRYFLNRPLIMLLEGLGVPFEVFKAFQDAAIHDVQTSTEDLSSAAMLLERHGLGGSFRLPSVMGNLHKLGFRTLHDRFTQRMIEFSVHHILREMKHHARIPIPGGWTLVGVADVHKYLQPREIFACLRCPDCHQDVYLEGPTLVSRSPTIHPGDVQILEAIGKPRKGSPFEHEKLSGCLVFSVEGERPMPNYLGGGDLDGDTYNVWSPTYKCRCSPEWSHLQGCSLLPSRTAEPGAYTSAEKMLVDHLCTMKDVADFFMDYISNDVLGIVGINWLIIADQSSEGIFDPDCLILAQLHSDAVDYPKSGRPVPLEKIPRLKFKAKPDWNAPETLGKDSVRYYESHKAIGRLFRAIDLPAIHIAQSTSHRQRRTMREGEEHDIEELLEEMNLNDPDVRDEVERIVDNHISLTGYISLEGFIEDEVVKVRDLFKAYTSELRTICMSHTLSHGRTAMLTEEEVVVGTIVAKASQPRKRKDLMSKMREVTTVCVRDIRDELRGDDDDSLEEWLRRAYISWKLAIVEQESFGGRSFWWICLGAIFDAINAIKDADAALDYV